MSLVTYRDLVGVAYTEEEAKALAAEIEVECQDPKISTNFKLFKNSINIC